MEKLGIIGGLGPAATARLFSRIVSYTDAACDQDHLDVTILNRPSIPDRTAFLLGKPGSESFVEPMRVAAAELESAGCTVLATPCNTAHARLDEIASSLTRARFVDMPASSARFACDLGCKRVGVLATDGALASEVHQRALGAVGLEVAIPEAAVQETVMSIIYDDVKAGRVADADKVASVCDAMADAGCDGIVLGCTELSLLGLPRRREGACIIDALDVLAWKCVTECAGKARDLRDEYQRFETDGSGAANGVGAGSIE
ncbi:aspartate/glutamate racemase family protein [Raoultibacter massiliensis]|uniref:Amino acid racemase n=1 Tax=Raoultibacter massiliensis TaxID=1852371 RepID=A0ABV1JDL3_9ACTN|nr:amino acid racemase [Raoultibacter massiliensis]